MAVPFLDLKAQYKSIKYEIDSAIQEVVDSCAFAGGPFMEKFEQSFAEYCKAAHAVGVGSGTEAIWIALLSLGIGPGDEVITVPHTFIATVEAITYCGAKPVFVDVDESTGTMDPSRLDEAISSRTKAIVPVHLYGQAADMDAILAIASQYDIPVVEDAAQAHGARYQGKTVATMGIAGCFSFYPGKNLGAFGEAGAVVTNDDALADRMRVFRDHGQPQKYHHDIAGWNGRMDGIQASVLTVKLSYLDGWNELRRKHAERYNRLLAELSDVRPMHAQQYNQHVYHLYVVRVQNRDDVLKRLKAGGIGCSIHYPIPVHLTGAYSHLGYTRGDFPVSEKLASQVISLPMFAELREIDVQEVVDELASCIRQAM